MNRRRTRGEGRSLRTCGSCKHWQQNFCEAPIPAWVERYFPIEIVDLADDDDEMAEQCEMYQERQEVRTEVERLREALNISPDDVGRIMHESWSRTKRSQGFHHPSECPNGRWVETARGRAPCPKCHADLIPWDDLPEPQKDINRHAFDDVLVEIRRRAALAESGEEG